MRARLEEVRFPVLDGLLAVREGRQRALTNHLVHTEVAEFGSRFTRLVCRSQLNLRAWQAPDIKALSFSPHILRQLTCDLIR